MSSEKVAKKVGQDGGQACDFAILQQYSARSARQHKAWGVSPRIAIGKKRKNPPERVTASTLDVSFVVFNSIRFQEFNKLIAKRNLSMMLLLFRNVPANFVHV